jgi:competence protein ComEA
MKLPVFLLSVMVAAAFVPVGAQQSPAPSPAAPPASDEVLTVVEEAATPVFTRMCTKCHPPDRILSQRRTKTQWEEVLEKMTKLGASGTDEEWETVQTYLLKHYGRINVNKAQADDLVQILDLTPADASAIVAYRKAQGDFAGFDALLKVPAVNTEKLQHARNAITF